MIVSAVLAACAFATPINSGSAAKDLARRGDSSSYTSDVSFNHWGGFSSLDNFDNFYGAGNFDGSRYNQVVVKDHEVVCHAQKIEIIQQRLAVIRELAKKVITETICDVETQVVVFEQFHSGLGSFKGDLRRMSSHSVGYDRDIASHYGDLIGQDSSISTDDWSFSGSDIGKSTVVVGGCNWDESKSYLSVNSAYISSRNAHRLSSGYDSEY